MTSAAVGFQCPDCVKAGRAQTRTGLAAYGGKRSANPAVTSIVLIVMNVLVWVAIMATGQTGPVQRALALLPADSQWGPVLRVTGVGGGAWWQILTSAFVHMSAFHLAMNMFALWLLGPAVENVVGRARFLVIYLLSAIGGSAMVMWLSDPALQTLGASGAIYGLLGSLLVIAIRHKGDTRQLWMLIGANVLITLVGINYISWQAHLGGFVTGAAITAALAFAPRARRVRWQSIVIGALALLIIAAIVVRAMQLALPATAIPL